MNTYPYRSKATGKWIYQVTTIQGVGTFALVEDSINGEKVWRYRSGHPHGLCVEFPHPSKKFTMKHFIEYTMDKLEKL
jgi:hypothetical protein